MINWNWKLLVKKGMREGFHWKFKAWTPNDCKIVMGKSWTMYLLTSMVMKRDCPLRSRQLFWSKIVRWSENLTIAISVACRSMLNIKIKFYTKLSWNAYYVYLIMHWRLWIVVLVSSEWPGKCSGRQTSIIKISYHSPKTTLYFKKEKQVCEIMWNIEPVSSKRTDLGWKDLGWCIVP